MFDDRCLEKRFTFEAFQMTVNMRSSQLISIVEINNLSDFLHSQKQSAHWAVYVTAKAGD